MDLREQHKIKKRGRSWPLLIYHAALGNRLIMCFMDSCPWNAPLPVFCQLLDTIEDSEWRNRDSSIWKCLISGNLTYTCIRILFTLFSSELFLIVMEETGKVSSEVIAGKSQHVNHKRKYLNRKWHVSPLRNQLDLDVERNTLTSWLSGLLSWWLRDAH